MQEETLFFTLDGKRLKELYVKNGQDVKAGDPIGELDVDDLRKQLRTKKLDFRRQEAKMKETLRNKDEMDPVDYDEAVIVFEEGRQELADLQEEIDKSVLKAPFSGKIVSLNVLKGDQIKAYDAICIVADTSQLTAAAKLTKDQLAKVAIGMEVVADINGIGQVKGVVKQLPLQSTDNDQNNQNGQLKPERPEDFLIVQLSKLPKGLQRGTPLSLNIIVNRKENAVVIPLSALRSIGARQYVQVVEADGSKREVDVEVGQQTSTQAEILKGLTPGQKVVGR
jgi:macrolide-specific efflux system membrane fusion protein